MLTVSERFSSEAFSVCALTQKYPHPLPRMRGECALELTTGANLRQMAVLLLPKTGGLIGDCGLGILLQDFR